MRIVHLLPYVPSTQAGLHQALFLGWQAVIAREVAKRLPYATVESWIPAHVKEPIVKEEDGIIFRAVPATKGNPLSYVGILSKLRETPGTILHIHDLRSPTTLYLIALVPLGIPIIYHDLGWLRYSIRRLPFEAVLFRRVSKFYVHGAHASWYLRTLKVDPSRIRVHYMGVDTRIFRPLDRHSCREILGLPKDKQVILFVGVFHETDGIQYVIEAFRRLQQRLPDVELVAVGGKPEEDYYDFVVKSCRYVWSRVPHNKMPYFLSAADVLCFYHIYPETLVTGGLGATIEESLACGTPVVSNTLVHFPDPKEIHLVGELVRTHRDLEHKLESVLKSPPDRNLLRDIALKHFDMNRIVGEYILDYIQLSGHR